MMSDCHGREWCQAEIARYKAILYQMVVDHRGMAKGLKRQAAKIKRLKARVKELEGGQSI